MDADRLMSLMERLLTKEWICVRDGKSAELLVESCKDAEIKVDCVRRSMGWWIRISE